MKLIDYMDDTWPCTRDIKARIAGLVEEGRNKRNSC